MFCDYLRMTGCFRTKRKSMKQNQRKHYDRTFVDILLFFSLDKIAKITIAMIQASSTTICFCNIKILAE